MNQNLCRLQRIHLGHFTALQDLSVGYRGLLGCRKGRRERQMEESDKTGRDGRMKNEGDGAFVVRWIDVLDCIWL